MEGGGGGEGEGAERGSGEQQSGFLKGRNARTRMRLGCHYSMILKELGGRALGHRSSQARPGQARPGQARTPGRGSRTTNSSAHVDLPRSIRSAIRSRPTLTLRNRGDNGTGMGGVFLGGRGGIGGKRGQRMRAHKLRVEEGKVSGQGTDFHQLSPQGRSAIGSRCPVHLISPQSA